MKRYLLAVAAMFALGCAGAAAAIPSAIPPSAFSDFAFRQNLGASLPLDTVLRDENGQPIALRSLFGSVPVILDFEYDRCTTLCGVVLDAVTARMRALPLAPGHDYRLIAIDIDPDTTPAEAVSFARLHSAGAPGASVLTGGENAIRRLADAAGFPYQRDAATGQYAHPAGIVVVTPQGTISRYLLGLDWRALDLRLALAEAAGERIAAPAESVLLFCYCYDPQTGQYDLDIARLLELVGIATLFSLGAFIWRTARKDRR